MSFADLMIEPEPEDDDVDMDSPSQTSSCPAANHAPAISNSVNSLASPLRTSLSSSSSLPQAMFNIRIPQVGPWMAHTSNPVIVSDCLHDVHLSLPSRAPDTLPTQGGLLVLIRGLVSPYHYFWHRPRRPIRSARSYAWSQHPSPPGAVIAAG